MRCLDLALSFFLGMGLAPACADNLLTMGVSSGGASVPTPVAPIPFCVNGDNSVATTVSCTTTASVPVGVSILVIAGTVSNVNGTITAVSDSGSNSYYQINAAADLINGSSSAHWLSSSSVSLVSGSTITATFGANIASHFIAAYKFNQQVVAGAVGSATHVASSTNPSCATSTSAASGSSIIGTSGPMVFVGSGSQAGWTIDYDSIYASTHRMVLAHIGTISSGTVTFSPTGYTGVSAWSCLVTELTPLGAYTGPGDIVPSSFGGYGLRCFTASKVNTTQAIRIRRASDSTQTDIGLTSTCGLDVNAATTFCASTTCFATKIYDQSSTGNDLAQATTTKQPQLIFNCIGSLPCLRAAGASAIEATRSGGNKSQPFSIVAVATRTGAFTSYGMVYALGDGTNTVYGAFRNAANSIELGENGTSGNVTASDSAWHVLQFVYNSNASALQVDSISTTLGGTFVKLGYDRTFLMSNQTDTQNMTGDWVETGFWPSAISSGNRTTLCSNAHAYWGIGAAC